jgi:dTDP-4-dehydrorhamnose reductase
VNRWLVTGSAGMLGCDLTSLLRQRGVMVTGLARPDLDVTDAAAVSAAIADARPDVVVNCAAWTAVDLAESCEDEALAVNGHGAANVAAGCASVGARMIQLSTDYVFDGIAAHPYAEAAAPGPASAYGRTKLAGERAVLAVLPESGYVVRTAWLYGAHGKNFVRTMIELERRQDTVAVVDDQHGQPTWTASVAARLLDLISAGAPPGVYHATCSGETTWFELAREVFRLLGADPGRVTPTDSAAVARPAPRPAYSVLGHDGWARASLAPIADWRVVLAEAFPALAEAASVPAAESAG